MEETYIITNEDREHFITNNITDEDKASADDGIISIVRLSDKKEWFNNEWIDLEFWGQS